MGNSVSAAEALQYLEGSQDCILVDVRSSGEFQSMHAEPAVNIPLDRLQTDGAIQPLKNKKKILCICQSGMRGKKAVELLNSIGFSEVLNVDGGTVAWRGAGLPTIHGKSRMSIERQVRITAGVLLLIGSLAAIYLSPVFLGLIILVGTGLIFAGVTDACGMAMILARCPWNK